MRKTKKNRKRVKLLAPKWALPLSIEEFRNLIERLCIIKGISSRKFVQGIWMHF
jgi:hypothetical protein